MNSSFFDDDMRKVHQEADCYPLLELYAKASKVCGNQVPKIRDELQTLRDNI